MNKILTAILAIAALGAVLLLPACASRKEAPDPVKVQEQIAEYRAQELALVRDTVTDQGRAERVIELLGDRDRLVSSHTAEISAYREKIASLNANYHAERGDFDLLIAEYNRQRESAQDEFLGLIGALKKETTADEWKKISKFQLKRLHPRYLSYGQATGGA